MTENRQPAPVGALETDGGRKQKSFWKWAALHFPSRRTGTYDLAKAEEKYGIEAETHWRDSDAPAPEGLPAADEQQKHNVLDKSLSVHELCVQSRDTPITSENRRPNLSVGAVETDGGRKKAGKEEKKNSFWKWPALHFPSRRTGTYDLAKAEEKYGIEAETHWRDSDAPAPEGLPAAEEQQKHNVLDKSKINNYMRIRKCYYKLFCIESNLHVKLYFILTTIVCLLIGLSEHERCVQSRDPPITSENRRPNLSVGAV
ncbi:uncharacterized protein LOC109060618 [Cyprinus carpio]|uniref:Uncharacterized protein LOC109060618 n=1 Tax=Cyprinus carpio TaxID=7962 RepID=A0A9Q9ZX64_CYPCA|nr:uncharacterized protein LOC109060618 [Cyprinus carpio]